MRAIDLVRPAITTILCANWRAKRESANFDGLIIAAQVREIAEMKGLIADLERNPTAADAPDLLPSADGK